MNIDPDLPEVPSFKNVQSLAEIKPVRSVDSDVEEDAGSSEDNFRKELREAIELLLHRHEAQYFSFTLVAVDGVYMVDIRDGRGDFLVRMPGDEFLAYANGAEGLPFLVDTEC